MPCINWVRSFIGGIFTSQYGTDLEKYIINKDPKTLADIELYTLEYNRKLVHQAFN